MTNGTAPSFAFRPCNWNEEETLISIDNLGNVNIQLENNVATLVNEKQNAGSYSVDFESRNLSSGVYFYKLQTKEFS